MKTGENREKNDQEMKAGLLDRIAAESGCMYLSDLRGCVLKDRCRFAVTQIPAAEYPVKAWKDAVYYIVGTEENFKTAEEAKQRILEHL
ncbi:hypothetical protein [Lacrimispora sp.]|uniref:hypothetical protein n=1 Tax=Lacrimispora sp. TaxID=2719234 RepID=UPI0039936EA3